MEIDFISSGISEFFTDGYAWLVKKWVIGQIKVKLFMLEIAYDVAKEVLDQFQITQKITEALSFLTDEQKAFANKLRIFEGLNLIIQSLATRFIFFFLPK